MSEVVHKAGGHPLRPVSGFASVVVGITAGAAFIVSEDALAQTQPVDANDQQEEELAAVTVTGSRIQLTTGMTTPTPVAALSAEEIAAMAPGSMTEAMAQLPQFYVSATAQNFNTPTNGFFTSLGGGSLNLRGVGAKRTLTLLDGRRVVPSTIYGGPDINMFPEAMLRNVETVTGGASAAYGTDAVSGVVNYVLDTGFSGISAKAQYGQTTRGDGATHEYSFTAGTDVSSGAHLVFSVGHSDAASIETLENRDWYKSYGRIRSSAAGAGSSRDNPLYSAPVPYMRATNASYDGVITAWQNGAGAAVPGFGRLIFNSDGTVSPFALGNLSSAAENTTTALGGGSGTDNFADRPVVQPKARNNNAFLYVGQDFGATTVYVQGLYSDQLLRAPNFGGIMCPGCQGNQPITIYARGGTTANPARNAFLPASLVDAMDANGISSFTLGRIGHGSDLAGQSYVQQDTQTWSATAGFKSRITAGGFFSDWNLDGYYQYGATDADAAQFGVRLDRLSLALDAVIDPATGRAVCNVTLVSGLYPDCRPLNLFGRGNASRDAIDWVTGFDPGVAVTTTPYLPGYPAESYSYVGDEYKHRLIAIKQHLVELSLNGKVMDGWAGPISAAFGATYREEDFDQKVQASQGNTAADPLDFNVVPANDASLGIRGVPNGARNNSVELQFSKVPFARGKYTVKELFTETLVPLFSGARFLERLDFNGAVRWADYGGSGQIWSYKAGLDSQFTSELRLRGTYSRDVRAPNLGERFDRTGGATTVSDPLLPAGSPAVNVTVVQGGNPAVDPEKADTFTAGFVFRPAWLDGFDLSVDWLDVAVKGSIEQFSAQQIVNACHVQNDLDQCANITRDSGTNQILLVNQTYQNISRANIRSVDMEMGYSRPIDLFGGGERLGLRIFATRLVENSTTNSAGVTTERAGQLGNLAVVTIAAYSALPKWKATGSLNYRRGPFRANLQARYVGGGLYDTQNGIGTNNWIVSDNTIGSVTYFDTRLSYNVSLQNGSLELFGNVTNLLDRDPPVIASYGTATANPLQYNSTAHDILGRRFTLGVNLRF